MNIPSDLALDLLSTEKALGVEFISADTKISERDPINGFQWVTNVEIKISVSNNEEKQKM